MTAPRSPIWRSVLFGLALACGRSEAPPGSQDLEKVPQIYRPLFGSTMGVAAWEAWRERLPYIAITLQTDGTLEPYTLTFFRDGKTELHVRSYKTGSSTDSVGGLGEIEYGRLCYLIDYLEFQELRPHYSAEGTDHSTTTITVETTSTKFAVSDYGNSAPISFWAIREAMEMARTRIEWRPGW